MPTKSSPLGKYNACLRPFLCISSILLKSRDGNEYDLFTISKNTHESCKENNIRQLQPSTFVRLFSCKHGFSSVAQLLRWILENANLLLKKGVSNLILDTLHDAREEEKSELIYLLKNILDIGINVVTFGEHNTPIKVGAIDDLISSDDHLNIIILSLLCKNSKPTIKPVVLFKPQSDKVFFDYRLSLESAQLLRVSVWLEV